MKKVLTGIIILAVVSVCAFAQESTDNDNGDSEKEKLEIHTRQSVTVESTGVGSDREKAVRDALYRAVEKVRGVAVGSGMSEFEFRGAAGGFDINSSGGSEMEFGSVDIKSQGTVNLAGTAGLVKGYEVIEEKKTDDDKYQVQLEVEVFDLPSEQEKVRIALLPVACESRVYRFLGTNLTAGQLSRLFTRRLGDELVSSGEFAVLDRENLARFAQEKQALRSLDAPIKAQAKMAETAGADYLLLATVTQAKISEIAKELETANYTVHKYKARFMLDYRIVDCLTKEIVVSSQVKDYLENEQVRKLADEPDEEEWNLPQVRNAFLKRVARKTAAELMSDLNPVKIAAVRNNQVILNQGEGVLSKGIVLDVYSQGTEVRDPDSGEFLGAVRDKVARIRVKRVTDRLAIAEVIDGSIPDQTQGAVCRVYKQSGGEKANQGAGPDAERTKQGGVKLPFD